MSKRQQIICWVALIVFVCTLLAIPTVRHSGEHISPIRNIPVWEIGSDQTIRFDILALEWLGLGVIFGALIFLVKNVSPISDSTKLKAKKFVEYLKRLVAIGTIVIGIGAGKVISDALIGPKQKSVSQQLAEAATDLNKTSPTMIDAETRFDFASSNTTYNEIDNSMLYRFTLVNIDISELDRKLFVSNVLSFLTENCPKEKSNLPKNVKLIYSYHDKHGAPIQRFIMNKVDCTVSTIDS